MKKLVSITKAGIGVIKSIIFVLTSFCVFSVTLMLQFVAGLILSSTVVNLGLPGWTRGVSFILCFIIWLLLVPLRSKRELYKIAEN